MPDETQEDWQTFDVLDDSLPGFVAYPVITDRMVFGNADVGCYEVHHSTAGLLPNSRFPTLADAITFAVEHKKNGPMHD